MSCPPGPCVPSIRAATGPASGFTTSRPCASTLPSVEWGNNCHPETAVSPKPAGQQAVSGHRVHSQHFLSVSPHAASAWPCLSLLRPVPPRPPEVQPLCQPSFQEPPPPPPPMAPHGLDASVDTSPPPELPSPHLSPLGCDHSTCHVCLPCSGTRGLSGASAGPTARAPQPGPHSRGRPVPQPMSESSESASAPALT